MAVTDLTNTTWILNSTLTSYPGGTYTTKNYGLNITTSEAISSSYGTDSKTDFTCFSVGYDSGGENNAIKLDVDTFPPYSFASGHDTKTLPDTWGSYFNKPFTITGGTDATNSTLITWLENNAVQQTVATPDISITYEDTEIATMSESGTKTLKTSGKYCTDDITIEYTKPEITPNLQAKTNIVPTSSSQTITADSGYDGLSSVQINAMPTMTLPTTTSTTSSGTNKATIGRSTSTRYINIPTGYNSSAAYYTISAVANGSATTPARTITPTITRAIDNPTGVVSISVSGSSSITPTVSAGYVSAGTAGTVSVSGSTSLALTTQAAQTITPTTTDQTIAANRWLTGTQTIKGDADLVASNIKKDVNIFGVTGTYEGSSGGTVAPVGSVICMGTNTNPSTDLGGTWELIEKKLTHWNINQANLSSDKRFFIPNTDNFTLSSALLYRADNSFTIRLIGTNLVALADTAVEFGTFVPNNMGLSEWSYGLYLEGSTDGGNGIIQFEITQSDSPTLQSLDVVTKTSGGSIAANNTIHLTFTFIVPTSCMLDSECDRFYFEKTSSSDYTVTTGAKTITSNGTYNPASDSLDYYSQVTVNVQGGATNIITGTFTGTTEDSVLTINTGYTDNGYPIAVQIAVDAGVYNTSTAYYSEIKRYAIGMWAGYKNYPESSPTYTGSGNVNQMSCVSLYKSSTSSATSYTRTSSNTIAPYSSSTDPTASTTACVKISNNSTLKVYIAASGTSAQGFLVGTTYRYLIYYSE